MNNMVSLIFWYNFLVYIKKKLESTQLFLLITEKDFVNAH